MTYGLEEAEHGPSLDRDAEIWVGTFPGLGSVRIHPDGEVEVVAAEQPDDEDDSLEMRERALRFSWGEPLSFARRGFRLTHGAAVGPVDSDDCMLILGDPHDVAIVLIELFHLGWGILGDRPTPLTWDSSVLTAYPRSAPVVASERRAAKAELTGTRLRGDTNTVALDLPRIGEPRRVSALVPMQMRKPDEQALTPLAGHERFETAAGLFMRGALQPYAEMAAPEGTGSDLEAAEMMADHVALSRLPAVRLRFDSVTKDDDVAALLAWWRTLSRSQ